MIRASSLVAPDRGTRDDVLSRPEWYLGSMSLALALLYAGLLAAAGLLTYALSGSVAMGWALQAPVLLFPFVLLARWRARALFVLAAAVGFFVATLRSRRDAQEGLAARALAVRGAVVATYYGSSSRLDALRFGNHFSSDAFSDALEHRYPGAIFYDVWSRRFQTLSSYLPDARLSELALGGRLFIHGATLDANGRVFGDPALPQGAVVEVVGTSPLESLYRVVRWPAAPTDRR